MPGKSKIKGRKVSPFSLFCPQCGTEINAFDSKPHKPCRRGPTDERFQEIASLLKNFIYDGKWKPGERIPTRRQLCQEYGASPITIQNIIDQFEADGFLRTERPAGTYVVKNPPNTVNVAMVFPQSKESSLLWKALSVAAEKKRDDGLKIFQFSNIKINGWTDSPEQVSLVDNVKRKKIMGIFFTSPPFLVDRTPILKETGIPRCALMDRPDLYPEISKFSIDGMSFQDRSLEYLKGKGKKKIAVIGHPWIFHPSRKWIEKIREYGMTSGPQWLQGMSIYETSPGENLARIMFYGAGNEIPDGLIITDDNLVESVTMGIAKSGVKVPSDLEVVAHCNFPCPPSSSVPVVRLGFDASKILETALSMLRSWRSTGPAYHKAIIGTIFENELKAG